MRTLGLVILALGVAGCDSTVTVSGFQMEQYFPFDGNRTWEFVSSDTSLDYRLVATLDPAFTAAEEGVTRIYGVSYHKTWEGEDASEPEWVRDVLWSSDGTFGTRIWGIDTPAGTTSYDPPIQLTDNEQLAGTTETTTTGGVTFTSTFLGNEQCPVLWTEDWGNDCIRLSLDDGGTGTEIAGDYWAITQFNVVGMQVGADTGVWQLSWTEVTYDDE